MGGMYHITMLVSGEQEDAIRSLFRDKNWHCWIKALSNEHLAVLMQGGFSDMFSLMETSESHGDNSFKEIKTEVIAEDDNELSDNQSLNETESTSKYGDSMSNQDMNVSGHTSSNSVDDTMNEELTDNKDDVLNLIKLKPANTNKNAISNNKMTDNGDKIIAPNPAYLMFYPSGSSQLVGSKGPPVGGIIQPMGSIMQPVGSLIQPVGNIMQQMSSMTQKGENSKGARRKSKPVRYEAKPDSKTVSNAGPECSICGERFKTQVTLKKHFKQVHVGFLDHGCNDCSERFETEKELLNHRRIVHDQSETTAKQPEPTKKLSHQELLAMGYLECPICHVASRNKDSLRHHMRHMHEGSLTWTCEICGNVYQSHQAYNQHKKESKHTTSIWMLGTYMCDSCGKMFKRYDVFKEHDTICKNGGIKPEVKKTVPCEVCGAMFKSLNRLAVHKRAVHTIEPCTCEICGVVKKNRQCLASHMTRHDPKNRKFSCDECNKSFFTPGLLRQHKRVHSKEKPFQCTMCDYRCAAKCNLHKHALGVHKVNLKASSVTESEYSEYSLPVNVPLEIIM